MSNCTDLTMPRLLTLLLVTLLLTLTTLTITHRELLNHSVHTALSKTYSEVSLTTLKINMLLHKTWLLTETTLKALPSAAAVMTSATTSVETKLYYTHTAKTCSLTWWLQLTLLFPRLPFQQALTQLPMDVTTMHMMNTKMCVLTMTTQSKVVWKLTDMTVSKNAKSTQTISRHAVMFILKLARMVINQLKKLSVIANAKVWTEKLLKTQTSISLRELATK